MAGFLQYILSAAFAGLFLVPQLAAQEAIPASEPSPAAETPRTGGREPGLKGWREKWHERFGPEDAKRRREAMEKLSPEERQKLRESYRRWQDMPGEQKREMRTLADRRQALMRREIDAALQALGYPLDDNRKQAFRLRYLQERRDLEEELRKEMEERRKPRVRAIIELLREEFAASSAAADSTAGEPSPSPSPAR